MHLFRRKVLETMFQQNKGANSGEIHKTGDPIQESSIRKFQTDNSASGLENS